MLNRLKFAVVALCFSSAVLAQNTKTTEPETGVTIDESAFTFTEAQLGEDDDMSSNVTILNSSNDTYASQVGFLFSPVRFRYRAYNQRYNEVYINGAPMNDMESGQFRYSMIGGLNNITRGVEFALPFEHNTFSMPGLAGSNNYDFRASRVPSGKRLSLAAANRNYTLRGMFSFGTGLSATGWALAGSIAYRWANRGAVEGTFYNSLSYFFGVQKVFNPRHSLSFATWGNPTERASQGASTDEMYWIANDYQYNPYWGYQNNHRRNSRVVNDFAPSALLTWDWVISDKTKLVTTLSGVYSMYKSTKLNYDNSDNPQPDYWKNMPSSYYDVWDVNDTQNRTEQGIEDWHTAYDYLKARKANRQVQWDRLYWANKNVAAAGGDAMYYVQAKHNKALVFQLASTLNRQISHNQSWNLGFKVGSNKGMHYQTMEDLLGASTFHNINSYAIGNYSSMSDAVQYDLNTAGPNRLGRLVYEGDKFGYDYDLIVHKGMAWTSYDASLGIAHFIVAGRFGGVDMRRKGHMRNGMFADNSFGKSDIARFTEGGLKGATTFNLGGGHTVKMGLGYQHNAPQATVAFVSPEMNNEFVKDLRNERIISTELNYQFQNTWLHANLNGYASWMQHGTEWQQFYFDDINSFSYVSLTNIRKKYYGVELGLNFTLSRTLNLRAVGTWSEAKNTNNANVRYLNSTEATYHAETVYNKGMREASTPLSAYNITLSYHNNGWFIDLKGNYYDRIYLSYSPSYRYESSLTNRQRVYGDVYDNEGNFLPGALSQAKGKGGFMLDGSIGKSFRLRHGQLSFNLMFTNLLNNQKICTGGYEQSRSDYTSSDNVRAYKFSRNPKKYYAQGTNGMFQVTYRF